MSATIALADPERALVVSYAPVSARPALIALFALDERLGAIVAGTTEPTIGLIRLAWWREALERLGAGPAPAEPLLRAVASDIVAARRIVGSRLGAIETGWAALLDGEGDADTIRRFAKDRGATLFGLAAALLNSDDARLAAAGEVWSLVDLAHRHSSSTMRAAALAGARERLAAVDPARWATRARPLAALLALARRDLAGGRVREQGSPSRVARMLAMRLFGR